MLKLTCKMAVVFLLKNSRKRYLFKNTSTPICSMWWLLFDDQ